MDLPAVDQGKFITVIWLTASALLSHGLFPLKTPSTSSLTHTDAKASAQQLLCLISGVWFPFSGISWPRRMADFGSCTTILLKGRAGKTACLENASFALEDICWRDSLWNCYQLVCWFPASLTFAEIGWDWWWKKQKGWEAAVKSFPHSPPASKCFYKCYTLLAASPLRMQRARKATLGYGCIPAGSGDGNFTPENVRRTFLLPTPHFFSEDNFL